MRLYECTLTFHDNLFYETRTMGRFYETGRLLHNIALSYALGLATTPFHHADDIPQYGVELVALNTAGVYVTPAAGLDVRYSINTFKFGDEPTSVFMEKSNRNLPTYGRAKEVAVGSQFRFGVLSESERAFPHWIRMGLWMSKARLEVAPAVPLTRVDQVKKEVVRRYPLNPTDLPDGARLGLFDLVAMRPSNLVEHAEISATSWWHGEIGGTVISLPVGLRYRVADAPSSAPPKSKKRGG